VLVFKNGEQVLVDRNEWDEVFDEDQVEVRQRLPKSKA
jgi:hypothetical protein